MDTPACTVDQSFWYIQLAFNVNVTAIHTGIARK